jgi:hypothetical protein
MKLISTFSLFIRLLSLVLGISLLSCEKDELDFSEESKMEEANINDISNNFRRKIENPYTIPNMQMALDSISDRMDKGKLKSATNEKVSLPKKGKDKAQCLVHSVHTKDS